MWVALMFLSKSPSHGWSVVSICLYFHHKALRLGFHKPSPSLLPYCPSPIPLKMINSTALGWPGVTKYPHHRDSTLTYPEGSSLLWWLEVPVSEERAAWGGNCPVPAVPIQVTWFSARGMTSCPLGLLGFREFKKFMLSSAPFPPLHELLNFVEHAPRIISHKPIAPSTACIFWRQPPSRWLDSWQLETPHSLHLPVNPS